MLFKQIGTLRTLAAIVTICSCALGIVGCLNYKHQIYLKDYSKAVKDIEYKNRSGYKNAFDMFKRLANDNKATASDYFYLGYMYHYGLGTVQNYSNAYEFYKRASESNVPRAYYQIGNLYQSGLGVDKDDKKAVEYFGKAYNLGYERSIIAITRMIESNSRLILAVRPQLLYKIYLAYESNKIKSVNPKIKDNYLKNAVFKGYEPAIISQARSLIKNGDFGAALILWQKLSRSFNPTTSKLAKQEVTKTKKLIEEQIKKEQQQSTIGLAKIIESNRGLIYVIKPEVLYRIYSAYNSYRAMASSSSKSKDKYLAVAASRDYQPAIIPQAEKLIKNGNFNAALMLWQKLSRIPNSPVSKLAKRKITKVKKLIKKQYLAMLQHRSNSPLRQEIKNLDGLTYINLSSVNKYLLQRFYKNIFGVQIKTNLMQQSNNTNISYINKFLRISRLKENRSSLKMDFDSQNNSKKYQGLSYYFYNSKNSYIKNLINDFVGYKPRKSSLFPSPDQIKTFFTKVKPSLKEQSTQNKTDKSKLIDQTNHQAKTSTKIQGTQTKNDKSKLISQTNNQAKESAKIQGTQTKNDKNKLINQTNHKVKVSTKIQSVQNKTDKSKLISQTTNNQAKESAKIQSTQTKNDKNKLIDQTNNETKTSTKIQGAQGKTDKIKLIDHDHIEKIQKMQMLAQKGDFKEFYKLKQAVKAGDIYAIYYIAHYYYNNKEYEKAIRYYKEAANKDYGPACYELANLYYDEQKNGIGYSKQEAVRLYKKAAKLGVKDARNILMFI